MERQILKFSKLLRQAGIKVSLSEVNDCFKALKMTGMDKPVFYQTLRSTLIKDQSFFKTFDRAFSLYFGLKYQLSKRDAIETKDRQYQGKLLNSDIDLEQQALTTQECTNKGIGQGTGRSGGYQERFVQLIRIGESESYRQFIKEGIDSLGELNREHLENIDDTIRKIKVFLEWNMGVNQLSKEVEEEDSELWWIWQSRLEEIEEILKQTLQQELVYKLGEDTLVDILQRENLNEIDFYKLSKNQVAEMRKKVTRMGHQLASRASFRKAKAKKGTIDLQRTIRHSLNLGGVPIKLAYRDRIPSKPEIWVLCDVSGSVKQFSEFMLQLMYSIQSRFLHVRSFVFIDTVAEASMCFQDREIGDAITEIYNTLKFSKTGFSDFGLVFEEVYKKYGNMLNKKVSLIIIGDARNNYRPSNVEFLMNIKEEVQSVIWLNPEPAELWNTEDSLINTYAFYCDKIFECRNLEQLSRVVRKLI